MRFKPLAFGFPLLVGLTLAISACEQPETEVETPSGETEIEQPAESPAVAPGAPTPTTSPTNP